MRPIVLFSVGGPSLALARHATPLPSVTAAPDPALVEMRLRQNTPNPLSVAQVLLTAFPPSLYQIAATNPATIYTIIWREFLHGSVPDWFANLPEDIRTYLLDAYVGITAPPASASPTSSPSIVTVDPSPLSSPSFSAPTAASSASPSQLSSTASVTPPYSCSNTAVPVSSASDPLTSGVAIHPSSSTSQTPSATNEYHSSTRSTEAFSSSSYGAQSSPSSSHAISSSSHTTATLSKSDLTTFSTATVTKSTLPAPTVDSAEPSHQSDGLSRNTKIGIGVGVPSAIIAVAALFGLCFLRRRGKGAFDEKGQDSDTPARLYNESPDGPYERYRPYGPYAPLSDENSGFQGTSAGETAGAATETRRRSLTQIDTNSFRDPALDHVSAPVAAAGHTTLRSSPHRKLRRGSGASLRSIEEEAEDGDLATAGIAAKWKRGGSSSPLISPVEEWRDPMDPPYQRESPEDVAQQKYTAFRSGSLKHNRRSSGALPTEQSPPSEPTSPQREPRRSLERRNSLTIGGGYRSLPSPHLQQPSQSYLLPRGEWLEDGEDLPFMGNNNRNQS